MALTIIFMIVIVTLYPIGHYSGVHPARVHPDRPDGVSDPHHHWALLSAIGIAGMDRVTRFNVIAMAARRWRPAATWTPMILDKTGTITFGNRLAADFLPVSGVDRVKELTKSAALSTSTIDTPEGKAWLPWSWPARGGDEQPEVPGSAFIEFTAQTRMSGVDLAGRHLLHPQGEPAAAIWVRQRPGRHHARRSPPPPTRCPSGGTPSPSAWASVCWVSST